MAATQDESNVFGIKVIESEDGEEHEQVKAHDLTRDEMLDVKQATADDATEGVSTPLDEETLRTRAEREGISLKATELSVHDDQVAAEQSHNPWEIHGFPTNGLDMERLPVLETERPEEYESFGGIGDSRRFLPQFLPDEEMRPHVMVNTEANEIDTFPHDSASMFPNTEAGSKFLAETVEDKGRTFVAPEPEMYQASDIEHNLPDLGMMQQPDEQITDVEHLLATLGAMGQEQEQIMNEDELFTGIGDMRPVQEEVNTNTEGNLVQDYFSTEPNFDIGAGVRDSFLDEHGILPPEQNIMNDLNEGLSFLNLSEEDFLLDDADEVKGGSEKPATDDFDIGAALALQQTTATGRYTPQLQPSEPPQIPSGASINLKTSKPTPITVPPPYAAPSLYTPSPYTLPSPYIESRPQPTSERQESFVVTNKAYASPYDLPMDVVPKRTRVTSHPLRSVMKIEDIPPPPLSAGLPSRNGYQPSPALERSGPNKVHGPDQRILSAPARTASRSPTSAKPTFQKQPANAFDPPIAPRKRPSFNRGPSSRGPSKLGMYTTEANATPQPNVRAVASSSSLPVHRTEENLPRRYPICRFAFGGRLVCSVPRISGFNWVAGDVQVHKLKDFVKTESFPGPLVTSNKASNKSKKDETLKYATRRIENEVGGRGLLWAALKLLLQYDMDLSGRQKEIHNVLTPELGLGETANFQIAAEVSRRMSVGAEKTGGPTQMLKNLLLRGDREAAVRHSIDHKLFAHALLIASTVSRDLWKEAVKAFVSGEVIAEGNESLATLFQVFSGAGEDAIDELLPSSFKTGYSMIPAHSRQETENFSALVKWRETLTMMLSNRSTDDVKAITGLGKVLLGRGWTEAAHICFLFAGRGAPFGPREDKSALFSLVGADLERNGGLFLRDVELIRMTEVFELALSQTSNAPFIPHVQAYKLHHAWVLTDYGFTTEAGKYCEILQQVIRANPKNPNYSSLKTQVDYLAQILESSSATWLGKKLSRPKLWGKFEGSFQKFIAGDETNHEKPPADGLFAKVAATPSVSRQNSSADIYSTYAAATYGAESAHSSPYSPVSVPPMSSRYAPLPKTDITRNYVSRPSSAGVGSTPYNSRPPSTEAQSVTLEPSLLQHKPYASQSEEGLPSEAPSMLAPPSFSPKTHEVGRQDLGEDLREAADAKDKGGSNQGYSSSHISPYSYSAQDDFIEHHVPDEEPVQMPGSDFIGNTAVEAETEEPAFTSYDPSRKASDEGFEDFGLGNTKPARPRTPEEEDEVPSKAKAKRDKFEKSTSSEDPKGWFGGWFKKKEADGLAPKAVKAKLGESMSMVFDPEQKRWVSPNAPASAVAAAPRPPPKRAVSAAPSVNSIQSAPPNAPPPPMSPQIPPGFTSGPASTAPTPPRTQSPLSRPPVNASTDSMDDLLAAATARKGSGRSTVGRSKRRYVVHE